MPGAGVEPATCRLNVQNVHSVGGTSDTALPLSYPGMNARLSEPPQSSSRYLD